MSALSEPGRLLLVVLTCAGVACRLVHFAELLVPL